MVTVPDALCLRYAAYEDAGALAALRTASCLEMGLLGHGEAPAFRLRARREIATLMREQRMFAWVLVVAGRIVGCACVVLWNRLPYPGSSRHAEIAGVYVAPEYRRRGYARDVERAFRTLLGRGRPGYVPSDHIRPHDAIAAIEAAGGIAVLAHPGRLRDEAVIPELVEAGLAGLEVFYPSHGPGQTAHFRELAKLHGLVMSAGSDFHDIRWNVGGVGIEVDPADLRPFIDLLAERPGAAALDAYRQRAQRP